MADKDFVVKNGIIVGSNDMVIGTALISNTTGAYQSGIINAASHTVGTSTVANSSGFFTGVINTNTINSTTVNAASHIIGTTTANSTQLYVGGGFVANSTGPYGKTEGSLSVTDASKLGGASAASYRLKSDGKPFPSGTVLTFRQTAAPTGYTKNTTIDDHTMRIVSGAVSSGGTMNFSSAFSSSRGISNTSGNTVATNQATIQSGNISNTIITNQATTQGGSLANTIITNQAATQGGNISGYQIGEGEMPTHSHGVTDPTHVHNIRYYQRQIDGTNWEGDGSVRSNSINQTAFSSGYVESVTTGISINYTGSAAYHYHNFTGSSHNHTQVTHGHTYTGDVGGHNHTQDTHGHTFSGLSHNHTQDTHSHSFSSSLQFDVKYVDFIVATAN